MTPTEQQAALREIAERTGYPATITQEIREVYTPTKEAQPRNPYFWRCSFIFGGKFCQSDAATPGQAILAALDHVRKELP